MIIVVVLIGNCFIGAIVFKTKSIGRTVDYLIDVNMAMSDLLFPIFTIPRILTDLYAVYWLIDGPSGLALCKLLYFLQECFYCRFDLRYLLLFVVEILVAHVVLMVLFILGDPGAVSWVGINGGESLQERAR